MVSRGRKPVQLIFANRVGRPSTRNRYHPRGGTRRIRFRNTIANVFFAFVYVFDYNEGINLSSILDSENLSRGNKPTHSLILGVDRVRSNDFKNIERTDLIILLEIVYRVYAIFGIIKFILTFHYNCVPN